MDWIKEKGVNLAIFAVLLVAVSYFLWIETWFISIKILVFLLTFFTLKKVILDENGEGDTRDVSESNQNTITRKDLWRFRLVSGVLVVGSIAIIIFFSEALGYPLLALSLMFLLAPYKPGDKL